MNGLKRLGFWSLLLFVLQIEVCGWLLRTSESDDWLVDKPTHFAEMPVSFMVSLLSLSAETPLQVKKIYTYYNFSLIFEQFDHARPICNSRALFFLSRFINIVCVSCGAFNFKTEKKKRAKKKKRTSCETQSFEERSIFYYYFLYIYYTPL